MRSMVWIGNMRVWDVDECEFGWGEERSWRKRGKLYDFEVSGVLIEWMGGGWV